MTLVGLPAGDGVGPPLDPPGHRSGRARIVRHVVAVCVLVTACDSTSISGLHVRTEPATTGTVVASIDELDTRVEIDCFVYGEPVHGDVVWYRISRPHSGYVTNYYIDTSGDGLAGIPSC